MQHRVRQLVVTLSILFFCIGVLATSAFGQLPKKPEDILPKKPKPPKIPLIEDLGKFRQSAKDLKETLKKKWSIELDDEVQYAIQPPRSNNAPDRKPDAVLYLKEGFKGSVVLIVNKGDRLEDLSLVKYLDGNEIKDWDDKIRSFKVCGKGEVVLYPDKGFGGKSFKKSKNVSELPSELKNNAASSLEIQ